MRKRLFLTVALLGFFAGCSDDQSNGDMGAGGDMSAVACTGVIPMASIDIINACTIDQRETVDIEPFYPDNAPNGTLPALMPPP